MSSTQQSIITKVGSNVLQDAGTSMPLRDRVKLMGPPSSQEYLAVPYYLGSFDSTDIGAEINKKILFETILPKYPPTVFFYNLGRNSDAMWSLRKKEPLNFHLSGEKCPCSHVQKSYSTGGFSRPTDYSRY